MVETGTAIIMAELQAVTNADVKETGAAVLEELTGTGIVIDNGRKIALLLDMTEMSIDSGTSVRMRRQEANIVNLIVMRPAELMEEVLPPGRLASRSQRTKENERTTRTHLH